MRIGRVIGTVTLSPRDKGLPGGSLKIVDVLDAAALAGHACFQPRRTSAAESLVVYDELGAAEGQLIAISEGGEAMMPFKPRKVPCDAYAAAILDAITFSEPAMAPA